MAVEWVGEPTEPHRAQLVPEGNTLKCASCGAHVMTFLDPPPAYDPPQAVADDDNPQ